MIDNLKSFPIFTDSEITLHTFNGLTANFYKAVGQGTCSINQDAKTDADYFCSSFYGETYKSTSYKEGKYFDSGKLGYQMHKTSGCTSSGDDIDGTDCSGVRCKIMQDESNDSGLYDIVCSNGQGT